MANELDALPESEAIRMLSMFIDTAVGTRVTMHTTRIKEVRAELLRLTARVQELERENGELREQSRIAHSRWSEFAQLSGAEQRKRISAESELAALRAAPVVHVDKGDVIERLLEVGYYNGKSIALVVRNG